MSVRADDSLFPLVQYLWPEETCDDDVASYLAHSSKLIAARSKHIILLDMRQFRTNTAKQRRMASDWLQQNEAGLRAFRIGAVTLASSNDAAATMRAVYWTNPPPYPWEIVADREQGLRWAAHALQKSNLKLPQSLAIYLDDVAI